MVHDFLTSRERTARWIQHHETYNGEFYSPSVPPSDYIPSRPTSEAESLRSMPPKMVLRYNDGRPDVPIHHSNAGGRLASSRGSDQGHSPRHGRSRDGRGAVVPNGPEQIRILPAPSSSGRHHARSKSLPRRAATVDYHHESVPVLPSSRHGSKHHRGSPTEHKVTFAPPAQPTQPWHRPKQASAGGGYAQYSPPVYAFPHQAGPNGVIYSHSAPVPGYYPTQYVPHSHRRTTSVHDPDRRRRHPAAESAETLRTDNSATYIVVPGPNGEKVHVIAPSPEHSVITATSTTKSAATPHTHHGKKPFFQRLFGKF